MDMKGLGHTRPRAGASVKKEGKRTAKWSAAALRGWKHLAKEGTSARVRSMAKRMLRKAGAT